MLSNVCVQQCDYPHSAVTLMYSYKRRLDTFKTTSWKKTFNIPSTRKLANAGFYKINNGNDNVQCAFCNMILSNWTARCDIKLVHTIHSPNCLLVRNEFRITQKLVEKCIQLLYPSPEIQAIAFASQLGIRVHFQPKHKQMTSIGARLATVTDNFPCFGDSSKNNVCRAGFFYRENYYICYHCNIKISAWSYEIHDTLISHAALSPFCEHINLYMGEKFVTASFEKYKRTKALMRQLMNTAIVRSILSKTLYLNYVVESTLFELVKESGRNFNSYSEFLERLSKHRKIAADFNWSPEISQNSNNALCSNMPSELEAYKKFIDDSNSNSNAINDAKLCKVCYENDMKVTLLPCGHFLLCTLCAAGIDNCVTCRKGVKATVITYAS